MHSKSKSGDWWCWCLSIFNLYDFFSLFFSFGLFYVISSIIVKLGGFSLINLVPSVPLQFIIVFLLADLKHYLWHRFMHINPFWELHKYHHSATELNLITAFRGHFLEKGVGTIFDGILFSILGTPIVQFNTLQIGKQFYDQLIHSDINWSLGWVGRHILISPKTHKIHHSSQPEFYDKNFGTFFVFWDKIFGTYINTDKKITIGVNGYVTKGFWMDMFEGNRSFISAVLKLIKPKKYNSSIK